jgi:hypothetical protein
MVGSLLSVRQANAAGNGATVDADPDSAMTQRPDDAGAFATSAEAADADAVPAASS